MKTKAAAKHLQSMGTGGDTILAHINPEEAAMLKAGGGSGKPNPKTGLLSFGGYEGEGTDFAGDGYRGGDAWAGPTHEADALNLLNFDRSQPAPVPAQVLAGIGSISPLLGLGGKLYNEFDNYRAGMNQGAGYGSGWGYFGNGFSGGPSVGQESGYGGDNAMSGMDNPGAYAQGGLLGAPQPAALPPTYPRPSFISKWGKPRGAFTNPYANRRGLLGG